MRPAWSLWLPVLPASTFLNQEESPEGRWAAEGPPAPPLGSARIPPKDVSPAARALHNNLA